MSRKSPVTIVGILVALSVCVFGVVTWINARSSLQAESTYQAFNLVLALISEHVEKTSGKWPESWAQLRETSMNESVGGWVWPNDFEEIESRVQVDFSTSTDAVISKGRLDFSAVSTVGRSYPPNRHRIAEFVERLKRVLHDNGQSNDLR
jgi:hypothetical protein